jgi:hypothetical protein
MSLVSALITRIGYRLGSGETISSTSNPSEATVIQWMNETALWLTGLCAENRSDLGRTIGSITTIHADISAATAAANCQITATGHGLISSGTCEVLIKDVVGMTELNDNEYTATYVSANALTLGVASTAYTAYTSGGHVMKRKFTDIASTMYCPAHMTDAEGNDFSGWIVKANSRELLTLTTEAGIVDYDPVEATEPSEFYVDGSNNICFPSYPDDAYTIKIPYYTLPTALTATTDTVPFLGIFDIVFIEDVVIRAQNRDEYNLEYEVKWRSFLTDMARKAIAMRKKTSIGVSV